MTALRALDWTRLPRRRDLRTVAEVDCDATIGIGAKASDVR